MPIEPPGQSVRRDGDLELRTDGTDGVQAPATVSRFVVVRAGAVAGTMQLLRTEADTGRLSWQFGTEHRGRDSAIRALRLLVGHALGALEMSRVEAYVEIGQVDELRTAARAGLRREGVVRGPAGPSGPRGDRVLLARLGTDPDPATPNGFRAILNAGLPLKRVIAQGLLRDPAGRVLLCELTYKPDWDLPGGVVEPDESPRECVVREVREELGIEVSAGELVTVDWLPPWAGWDDACLFMFDLGVVEPDLVASMQLEPREIAAVHWADPEAVRSRCREQVADRLALLATGGPLPRFLHSGRLPS